MWPPNNSFKSIRADCPLYEIHKSAFPCSLCRQYYESKLLVTAVTLAAKEQHFIEKMTAPAAAAFSITGTKIRLPSEGPRHAEMVNICFFKAAPMRLVVWELRWCGEA